MSVARCKSEIDSAEFSEWLAFDQIDPIGNGRSDLRMGILASTIVSAAYPKSKCCPIDFMPDFDGSRRGTGKERKRQSEAEIELAIMKSVIITTRAKK